MDILISIILWGIIIGAFIGIPIFFIYDQKRINRKIKQNREEEKKLEVEEKPNMMYCPDCGKEISKQAEKCPNCGKPLKNNTQSSNNGCIIILGIILLIFGICMMFGIKIVPAITLKII